MRGYRPAGLGAATDDDGVQEQVDVVDEPGTEGLSGEGGAADAHVEDTARLELLDAGRVEG